MSHTISWPNRDKEHLYPNYGTKEAKYFRRIIPVEYRDRIGNPSAFLSLQADVLYPNAIAVVCADLAPAVEDLDHDGEGDRDPLSLSLIDAVDQDGEHNDIIPDTTTTPAVPRMVAAVGCKGNQFDIEFPFEPRVPVALPLIQYPTPTSNQEKAEEHDACSLPVLNWEKYIKNFHGVTGQITATKPPNTIRQRTPRPGCIPSRNVKLEKQKARARLRYVYDKRERAELAKLNDPHVEGPGSESTRGTDLLGLQNDDDEPDFSEDEQEALNPSSENRIQEEMEAELLAAAQVLAPHVEPSRKTKLLRAALSNALLENRGADVEENEAAHEVGHEVPFPPHEEASNPDTAKKFLKNITLDHIFQGQDRQKVPLATFRKYTRQPNYKIEGTWNYLFNGHGACDWIRDPQDKARRHVLVGYGTKLRVATLKPSERRGKQMFSYTLDNVWEEDSFPTNIKPGKTFPNEEVSDLILQIVTARKGGINNCLGAVRRGRSIEVYRFDGTPSLVTSVANAFYGTNKYEGYKSSSTRRVEGNPLLVSCDLNPWFPEEMTTLDENNVLTFVDFARGKTIYQISPTREYTDFQPHQYPRFPLNDSSGVTYANHPRTCYFWADSHIYYHDYRTDLSSKTNCLELLNLRTSPAVRAWTEEYKFEDDDRRLLETVSAVKQSSYPDSTYYHVGTTSRVLLMDIRVPGNPVLKLDHGMKSPAAYLDACHDDNDEVMVAGSQRSPEVFCAVHDNAHVACSDRPQCTARNPTLHSFPRHLSNPRQFFEFAETQGLTPSWEADHAKTKEHCYAWSTGLSIMKLSHRLNSAYSATLAPGFVVLQGNSFGDLFYQEWDQLRILAGTKTRASHPRLKSFLNAWKQSMTSKNPNEYYTGPPLRRFLKQPENCTLIVESCADFMKNKVKPREKPFSSIELAHKYTIVERALKPLPAQLKALRSRIRKGTELENQLLNVWAHVPAAQESEEDPQASMKYLHPEYDPYSLTDLTRDLTEEERRVLAEIKHEAMQEDFEFIDVNDDEVQVIEQNSACDASGFDLMEVEDDNQGFAENQDQEEFEELARQLYPSVTDRFHTDGDAEPELIIPDQVESDGEWEDVVISDDDDDSNEQSPEVEDQGPADEEFIDVPAPIPIPKFTIDPERLERDILGVSDSQSEDADHQQLLPSARHMGHQQYASLSLVSHSPPRRSASQSALGSGAVPQYLESQQDLFSGLSQPSQPQLTETEEYAVDDASHFEAAYFDIMSSIKYDQSGPAPGTSADAGHEYESGGAGAELDPESEAFSAHFSQSSHRT